MLTVKIVSGCITESQSLTLEQAVVVGYTLLMRRNLEQDRANTGDPPDDGRGKEDPGDKTVSYVIFLTRIPRVWRLLQKHHSTSRIRRPDPLHQRSDDADWLHTRGTSILPFKKMSHL